MDGYLKQSTDARVIFGPFVSSSDGHTLQQALTLSTLDLRISKNGGAQTKRHLEKGAYHDKRGMYWATLDATDTGTVGRLQLYARDHVALAVYRTYHVIPRERYNQFFASTDYPYSDVRQWNGGTLPTVSTLDRTAIREAVSSSLDRGGIRASLLTDGTRFAGARINTVNTVDTRTKLRATFLTDDTRFGGARLLVVNTLDTRTKVRAAIIDDDTRFDASRLNTCSTMDRAGISQSVASTLDRSGVLATLINDGTRLDGSRLNTCSTPDRGAIRASILSDTTRISGASFDYVVKNFKRSFIANTNQLVIHTQKGSADLYASAGGLLGSVGTAFTSDSKTRTRKRLVVT